ncbi:MAG: RNA-binding cell elongation regulator Jag/EloR [bacterium]
MNEYVEFSGKTYEEAISKALQYFKVDESNLVIEKISENPSNILDIIKSKKTGEVFIKAKLKEEPNYPDYLLNAIKIVENIIKNLEANVKIIIKKEDHGDYIINLEGEDKGLIIGKYGNNINAIQNYVNFIINKNIPKDKRVYVIIDSDNYREKRKKKLIEIAIKNAKKVQLTKKPIILPPMLAFERKIIHMALKNNQYVTTYSIGENPYKSVVIAPLLDTNNLA